MNLTIQPTRRLSGIATVPGDKSLSHRAALFAALAEGESVIDNFLVSGVTRAMLEALTALGVTCRLDGTHLTIGGRGLHGWSTPATTIDCRNSATTFRLLTGAIVATGIGATLDGSVGLRRRPMNRIVGPLQDMGAAITGATGTCAPLTIKPRSAVQTLHAASINLSVASAQVKSCFVLAALAADGPVTICEPGPSRDHTERLLMSMGVHLDVDANRHMVTVHPLNAPMRPLHIELPGDFSAAAFLIVAALIVPEAEVVIRNVGLNATRTGLLDALRAMGGNIEIEHAHMVSGEPAGDLRIRASALHGTIVEGDLVVRMIDEFPAFAVAAAYAHGVTTVRDAVELRHKESDRIAQQCLELRKLGVDFTEADDGFIIRGGRVQGGTVLSHGDHRIAMSMAIAGLAADAAVTVQAAEIIDESFPDFIAVLKAISA